MPENALPAAAREQLKYWQDELAKSQDEKRDRQCERRFIKQCEIVIEALERTSQVMRRSG